MTKDQIITLAIAKYTKKKVEDSGFEIVVPVWISENSSHTSLDVQDFLKKFFDGYNNRPSQRTSGEMKSVSDPLIDELIEERIDGFDKRHVRLFISFYAVNTPRRSNNENNIPKTGKISIKMNNFGLFL